MYNILGRPMQKLAAATITLALLLAVVVCPALPIHAADQWAPPTEHYDPYDVWSNEENAYDEDTGTFATQQSIPTNSWGNFLELSLTPLYCHTLRFYALYSSTQINKIDLDVYYGDNWHNVFEGSYANVSWVEKELPEGTQKVYAARVRFYNDDDTTARDAKLYEFAFHRSDPPAPANMQVESAQVCRHLLEADDFLLVFHYNIHYSNGQPEDPANKVFTFRLLDTDGETHLGAIIPYVYYNAGYDQGCSAFYFPAADAPAWGLSYKVVIAGNPAYFANPPTASYTLVTSDYSQVETSEENQTILGNYVVDVAELLENNWATTLLTMSDMGTILNTSGEAYFRGAITGLQYMAPQIFAVQVTPPEYEETEWTKEKGEEYKGRFEDTWVGEGLAIAGDAFHVQWNVLTGLGMMAVILGLAIISYKSYATVKPAMVSAILVLLGGTVLGWVSAAIMGITTVLFGLFLGYVWFFRHG